MVLMEFERAPESFGRSIELSPKCEVKNYLYFSFSLMNLKSFDEAHLVLKEYLIPQKSHLFEILWDHVQVSNS